MNLRISNLSYINSINIDATDSALLFNGTKLATTTGATLALIPDAQCRIEGTLRLIPDDRIIQLKTDLATETVTISSCFQDDLCVPFYQNIAIELNNDDAQLSVY